MTGFLTQSILNKADNSLSMTSTELFLLQLRLAPKEEIEVFVDLG